MKFLFAAPALYKRGGIIVTTTLAKALAEKGHDVEVACFALPKEETIHDYFLSEKVTFTFLDIEKKNQFDDVKYNRIEPMKTLIAQKYDDYDYIIIDSWFNVLPMIYSNKPLDKFFQLVQSLPEFDPRDESELWKSEIFKVLPRYPHKKIGVSTKTVEYFKTKYEQNIDQIPLFIDNHFLKNIYSSSNKEHLEIITSAANFNSKEKGLDFLLQSLESYTKKNFSLTILSNSDIQIAKNDYSFPISIVSAENPPEMVEHFHNKDVYINTSRKETFCLALAEAMSLGMPSIVTDSIGNREYITPENSLLIDTQEDLHTALNTFQEYKTRIKFSQNAHESLKEYSVEKTIKQFLDIINT